MKNIAKDLKDTSKKMVVKDVRSNHQFRFIGDNVDFYSKVHPHNCSSPKRFKGVTAMDTEAVC